jgi:hypothetical protein
MRHVDEYDVLVIGGVQRSPVRRTGSWALRTKGTLVGTSPGTYAGRQILDTRGTSAALTQERTATNRDRIQ